MNTIHKNATRSDYLTVCQLANLWEGWLPVRTCSAVRAVLHADYDRQRLERMGLIEGHIPTRRGVRFLDAYARKHGAQPITLTDAAREALIGVWAWQEAERRDPCPSCSGNKRTGLPGNACENCMNTGLKYPTAEDAQVCK
jgi:hypothetical protein